MLAVFKTGGKQYSVKAGQILKVEKLEGKKVKIYLLKMFLRYLIKQKTLSELL